ncbi:zf-TFIIB domain-containing protein [Leptolyngbya sp. FACHB-261]|nr:zf-TFIIB domain-containing protein [Leptolyngbya sp. FACHB-261]
MQCPKDKKISLLDGVLSGNLPVKCCPDCKGTWIPAFEYREWLATQPEPVAKSPNDFPIPALMVDFVQSPLDTKAALCPDCGRYLSRARVGFGTPFYVERCLDCGGIWCDYGEWEVLEKLGLQTTIAQMFSAEWQMRVRENEQAQRERRLMIERLGEDLASQVFDLARVLEVHPHGDFAVAYLMRRFDHH